MKAKLLAVGKDELGRSPSGDTLETLVEATNEMDSSRASRISFADDGGGDLVSNQKELDEANDDALDNTIAVVQGTWQEIKDALGDGVAEPLVFCYSGTSSASRRKLWRCSRSRTAPAGTSAMNFLRIKC